MKLVWDTEHLSWCRISMMWVLQLQLKKLQSLIMSLLIPWAQHKGDITYISLCTCHIRAQYSLYWFCGVLSPTGWKNSPVPSLQYSRVLVDRIMDLNYIHISFIRSKQTTFSSSFLGSLQLLKEEFQRQESVLRFSLK